MPRQRRRLPWVLLATATVFALATIAVIWFAAVPWGPMVCPAIDPPPRNCFESTRAATGLVMTVGVVVVYALTLAAALIARRRAWVIAGVVLLVVAPVVSYLAVAWVGGL